MKVLCEKCGALAEGRLESRPGGGAALGCGACGAEIDLPAPAGRGPPEPSPPPSTSTAPPTASATPGAASSSSSADADGEAWAQLLSRWDDEEAHGAFLSRFGDLDGLAGAGWRYRQVLSERPGDAVALRWRDEILRRATAQGLSQLPRLSPPRPSPKAYRWAVLAGMVGAMALAAGWMAWRLLSLARG